MLSKSGDILKKERSKNGDTCFLEDPSISKLSFFIYYLNKMDFFGNSDFKILNPYFPISPPRLRGSEDRFFDVVF